MPGPHHALGIDRALHHIVGDVKLVALSCLQTSKIVALAATSLFQDVAACCACKDYTHMEYTNPPPPHKMYMYIMHLLQPCCGVVQPGEAMYHRRQHRAKIASHNPETAHCHVCRSALSMPEWQQIFNARQQHIAIMFQSHSPSLDTIISAVMLHHSPSGNRSIKPGNNTAQYCHHTIHRLNTIMSAGVLRCGQSGDKPVR